jgi:hypothetical protein
MRNAVLIYLFLFSTTLSAGFYKWVDSDGVVHYTDHPVEQAEELRLPGAGDHPGASDSESTKEPGESSQETQQTGEYTQFEVLEPEQNQTLRNDEREVRIGMLLQPALQEGHRINLSVDGILLKDHNISTQLILSDVPRGSHSLQATIIDEEGQPLISTPVVNFHMRKAVAPKAEP